LSHRASYASTGKIGICSQWQGFGPACALFSKYLFYISKGAPEILRHILRISISGAFENATRTKFGGKNNHDQEISYYNNIGEFVLEHSPRPR
jgi:hypothetical protein